MSKTNNYYELNSVDFLTGGGKPMSPDEMLIELNALREAVIEAHRIILHEMDNGRTPTMLKAEHGGKGFGYFEDLITP